MGDSITEGTVLEWVKGVGDYVAMDDVVVVIETDKVSVDVRAPAAGLITQTFGELDDVVTVGSPLMELDTSAEAPADSEAAAAPAAAEAPKEAAAPAAAAAPTAAPAAPAAPAAAPAAPAAPAAAAPAAAAAAAVVSDRGETRVKMTRMRQTVARRLKEAQNTYAMLTTFQECDMGNLIDMRKRYKDDFEKAHGVRLGFMSAFVKASTAALKEIPAVNAVIDDETQEVVYRDYCDVSFAAA
jgi:2-oxoglutarate dehydrogenase E2 component (dihydrolipoamide succinyltransferase)